MKKSFGEALAIIGFLLVYGTWFEFAEAVSAGVFRNLQLVKGGKPIQ